MRKFHLEIGEPVAVGQGDCKKWGPYQFPTLSRTRSGAIHSSWALHNDDIVEFKGKSSDSAVSEDNGKTWREQTAADVVLSPDLPMPNGKLFVGFAGQGAYEVDYFEKYTPDAIGWDKTEVYDLDKVPEIDRTVIGIEYDPETGKNSTFPITLNWPHMPVTYYYERKLLYPVRQQMAITGVGMGGLALDDGLYFCTYGRSLKVQKDGKSHYSTFVFRSTDSARTWDMIAEIAVDDDSFHPSGAFEGLCEPCIEQMPDGSVVILMRTGGGCPSYLTRSTDNCKTWCKPILFDKVGVLPQIWTLDCGVSIATYGRPGLFVRASSDPAGLVWEDSIELELSPVEEGMHPSWKSCCYTRLLPLDAETMLMVYSDFNFPDKEDGVTPRKSIVARSIHVVFDD